MLKGTEGGGTVPDRDIPRYIALHEAGRLELEPLVTAAYTLDTINDAIDDMRAGRIPGAASWTSPDGAADRGHRGRRAS